MAEATIESDPLFVLLTDALRAGPGSPQWAQAVAQLRERGQAADDYASLVEARKNLEAGREYRTVRAGPGFTRKVLTAVDQAGHDAGAGVPTANLVAAASAVVIVVVLGVIAYLLIPAEKPATGVDQLTSSYFASAAATLRFDGPLPEDWKTIGSMPLETRRGLRPAGGVKPPTGGGVYWTSPLPLNQPTAIEATVRIRHPNDDVTAQLFVTDTADFSADRGTSSHELVWQTKGQRAQVFLPSGLSEGIVDQRKDPKERTVRLVLNRDWAYVDMNGKRLWSGPHQLSPDSPRYVGVRLIRTAGEKGDPVVVTGLRVLKP